MRLPLALQIVVLAFAVGGGCDESDAVSVSLRLDASLGGELTVCRLVVPDEDGPVRRDSSGITWGQQAALVCASGRFDDIARVQIGDVTITRGGTADGLGWVRVRVPVGPEVRWPALLTLVDEQERKKALDGLAGMAGIGESVKFSIELPDDVVTHGIKPERAGVSIDAQGDTAEMLVPVHVALTAGDPLVWTITWE